MTRPDRIGRYRIDGVIGAGSFATAHRAVDERLESVVVVKVLAENHSLNAEIRERFIAEGRSLRKVRSDNVVTVHDIGETDRQQPYLVLELAERGTLADRVESLRGRGWTATAVDVLALARPLGRAVEAVHAAGLVHRDLSPGNVLLRSMSRDVDVGAGSSGSALVADDERVLLADLGMCKDLAVNSGLTVAGGTDGFRPPEQRTPGPIDTRADLWALSALMKWMTEGSSLPTALDEALDRSLAEHPDERHADVDEWMTDIEAALLPPQAGGSEGEAPGHEPASVRPVPSGRLRVLAAVAAAFVLGAVAAYFLAPDGANPSSADGASIGIVGPDDVSVGETVTFTAETDGVDSWVWQLPTGRYVIDEPAVTVTPTGPGRAKVEIEAATPDGSVIEASHAFTVTGDG